MKNASRLLLLSLLLGLISACGHKQSESHADSQVVAKANDAEISIHQLNFQLARLGKLDEKQAKQVAPELLKRLVNQELMKQEAVKAELDRDPRVLQAIEASKTEILAQAFLERELAKATKPSEKEIDAFYQSHPELFSERRLYKLQEIAVVTSPSEADKIRSGLQGITDINQIAQWLKTNNYTFNANTNVRAAEQLPLNLLAKLYKMKDGEYVVVDSEKSVNIVHIGGSESKPISREQATPLIEQFHLNQSRTKLAQTLIENQTKSAKVEYYGEFAQRMVEKPSSQASSQSAAPAPAQVPAEKADASRHDDALSKGLSGL